MTKRHLVFTRMKSLMQGYQRILRKLWMTVSVQTTVLRYALRPFGKQTRSGCRCSGHHTILSSFAINSSHFLPQTFPSPPSEGRCGSAGRCGS